MSNDFLATVFGILRSTSSCHYSHYLRGLAAQTRLSRTAVLEVLRQDYVRTARAKGVPPSIVLPNM